MSNKEINYWKVFVYLDSITSLEDFTTGELVNTLVSNYDLTYIEAEKIVTDWDSLYG